VSGIDGWEDQDEMGLASAFVMGVLLGAMSAAIISAAVIWNAASLVAETWKRVRS
jgi:hypothetical protein